MVEPCRLAARAAARRIAQERGCSIGREVGYRVRFDDRSSRDTRILVCTEGVLVRMLQEDPFLEGVGALVFDEFHERNLLGDLALAMARRVRAEARPDLGLTVMSATLQPDKLAHWLGDCPVVESEGRLHPVEIRYLDPLEERERPPLAKLVARHAQRAATTSKGHVLVFLPGVGEIRRTRDELERERLPSGFEVLELYGDLSPEEQDRVLAPRAGQKLILATNVAETSVTIDGVEVVVDSGQVKRLHHDPAVGLDRLRVERISKASAEQRAGRAGRTGPGRCLRLWSQMEQRALSDDEQPEIQRLDLSGCLLELAAWGETELARFPWFEPPPPAAIQRARGFLELLGALAPTGSITDLGRLLVRVPAPPRLARLLLEGARRGVVAESALAAALLSERDPFRRGARADAPTQWSACDVTDRVRALEHYEARGATKGPFGEIQRASARHLFRVRDQLARLVEGEATDTRKAADSDEALRRTLLAAFPDRLCRRRVNDPDRGVMVGGRGVRLGRESAVREGELFCAVQIEAGKNESFVRLATRIERDCLPENALAESTEVVFDEESERVRAKRRVRCFDLVLEESAAPVGDAQRAADVLVQAARSRLQRALALDDPALASFLARLDLLRTHCPELELPAIDDDRLAQLLPQLCVGMSSFAELRRAPLLEHLRASWPHTLRREFEREAPIAIKVPSGSEIRLTYATGCAPVLAVRIQEMFGLARTPRVARGRVPVLLHLLAPNRRPQQVTDDLESFWNGAYQEVRKELRRRYPKHAWPEDPWSAEPLRGVKRRRRD